MTLVLDAGALIALERGDRAMWARYANAVETGMRMSTHGGVVGQVFRGGSRGAGLVRALAGIFVAPLDEVLGRRAGVLLGATGSRDVVDAALVLLARDGDVIATSDIGDLRPLAAAAKIEIDLVRV